MHADPVGRKSNSGVQVKLHFNWGQGIEKKPKHFRDDRPASGHSTFAATLVTDRQLPGLSIRYVTIERAGSVSLKTPAEPVNGDNAAASSSALVRVRWALFAEANLPVNLSVRGASLSSTLTTWTTSERSSEAKNAVGLTPAAVRPMTPASTMCIPGLSGSAHWRKRWYGFVRR